MKWFLVFTIYGSCGGIDCGIVQGYRAPVLSTQHIEMPSKEMCETILELNKYAQAECWAKPDKKQ